MASSLYFDPLRYTSYISEFPSSYDPSRYTTAVYKSEDDTWGDEVENVIPDVDNVDKRRSRPMNQPHFSWMQEQRGGESESFGDKSITAGGNDAVISSPSRRDRGAETAEQESKNFNGKKLIKIVENLKKMTAKIMREEASKAAFEAWKLNIRNA